jgi:hypothetical protein
MVLPKKINCFFIIYKYTNITFKSFVHDFIYYKTQRHLFQAFSCATKNIRIEVNCTAARYYVEIDAIRLHGCRYPTGICSCICTSISLIIGVCGIV